MELVAILTAVLVATVCLFGLVGTLRSWADPEAALNGAEYHREASPFAAPGSEAALPPPPSGDVFAAFRLAGSFTAARQGVERALGPMFVGGWIMAVLDYRGSGSGSSDAEAATPVVAQAGLEIEPVVVLVAILGLTVCIGSVVLLRAWIASGWIRLHRDVWLRGEGSFRTLFSGADRMWAMLGWRILRGTLAASCVLPALAGFAVILAFEFVDPDLQPGLELVVAMVPATLVGGVAFVWIGSGLLLGEYFVALEEDGPVRALRRSLGAAHGHRGDLVGFYLLWHINAFVILLLGFLALCVGAVVSIPLSRALMDNAWCRAYLRLSGALDESWEPVAGTG